MASPLPRPRQLGRGLLHEGRSRFSHFKIYDRGAIRYLMFVRDNGDEVVESAMDVTRPDQLEVDYTRVMFASHLLRPRQQRVLIVGLGGGSMVRFLHRYFPEIHVTAVEIDRAVADAARDYFGVTDAPNVAIVVDDGFELLARATERWDVIYMDAFLKPGPATDQEGAPLRMQTIAFLRGLQTHLVPGGMFVVNINVQDDTPEDVEAIGAAFANRYIFGDGGNLIVIGSTDATRVPNAELERHGRELDRRADYGFSFAELVDRLREPEP